MSTEATFSRELMDALNACELAEAFLGPTNLWDAPASIVERSLKEQGKMQELYWWREARKSPQFVRFYGKEITVISYKVFDPTTGLHTTYDTKAEAEKAYAEVALKIVQMHGPNIVRAIRNENGDEAWEPIPDDEQSVVEVIVSPKALK